MVGTLQSLSQVIYIDLFYIVPIEKKKKLEHVIEYLERSSSLNDKENDLRK